MDELGRLITDADEQFHPRTVNSSDLDRWELLAKLKAPDIRAGEGNWPMIVLSLIEAVRRLPSVS
jgi:hypothetical protein